MGQEAGLPMFVQGLRLCVLSLPVDAFAVWAPADNILRGSGEREKLAMERGVATVSFSQNTYSPVYHSPYYFLSPPAFW